MNNEEVKQRIIDEIEKTEQQIIEYKELVVPQAPDVAIGRVSRMDAINNRSVVEASLRQAEQKLKSLERVLSKHGTNEFGICVKCKREIPIQRILYRPESMYCVNCAR